MAELGLVCRPTPEARSRFLLVDRSFAPSLAPRPRSSSTQPNAPAAASRATLNTLRAATSKHTLALHSCCRCWRCSDQQRVVHPRKSANSYGCLLGCLLFIFISIDDAYETAHKVAEWLISSRSTPSPRRPSTLSLRVLVRRPTPSCTIACPRSPTHALLPAPAPSIGLFAYLFCLPRVSLLLLLLLRRSSAACRLPHCDWCQRSAGDPRQCQGLYLRSMYLHPSRSCSLACLFALSLSRAASSLR